MSEDRDDVAQLFDQIASEKEVIDQLAAGTRRLQAIQRANRALSTLDAAALRRAVARRHAALEISA